MQGASHQLSHSLSLGKLQPRAGRTSEGWLPRRHLPPSAPRHRSMVGGGPNIRRRRCAVGHKDTLPGSQFLHCRGEMSKEISLQTGSSQEKMIGTGSSVFGAVFGGKAGGTGEVPFQRIMRLDPVFPELHLHEPSRGRGACVTCLQDKAQKVFGPAKCLNDFFQRQNRISPLINYFSSSLIILPTVLSQAFVSSSFDLPPQLQ